MAATTADPGGEAAVLRAARRHARAAVHPGDDPRAAASVYLRGIDNTEIIHTIHERRPPMISASAGLRDKR